MFSFMIARQFFGAPLSPYVGERFSPHPDTVVRIITAKYFFIKIDLSLLRGGQKASLIWCLYRTFWGMVAGVSMQFVESAPLLTRAELLARSDVIPALQVS
jgi:hypothetical protein